MLGTPARLFTDLIDVGERIDTNVREGRLESQYLDNKKGPGTKKKEGDVNHVSDPYQQPFRQPYTPQYRHPRTFSYNNHMPPAPYQPRSPFTQSLRHPQPVPQVQPNQQANVLPYNGDPKMMRFPRDDRPLPSFNVTRSELFRELVEKKLMGPRPTRPLQPPFPSWYNPNETCEYHMGITGHTIDRCDAFRRHVLDLLDNNYISVRKDNSPNIASNPLPEHDKGKQVCVIEEDMTVIKDVNQLKFTMREIFEHLKEAGYVFCGDGKANENGDCGFCKYHHRNANHGVEDCGEFKEMVQKLMILGVIRVERDGSIDKSVCMMDGLDESMPLNKSKGSLLVVNTQMPVNESRDEDKSSGSLLVVNQSMSCKGEPLAFIHVPAPFPYHSNHEVPWNYGLKIEFPMVQGKAGQEGIAAVNNQDVISGVTRSGRLYSKENDKMVGDNRDEGEASGLKMMTLNDKKAEADEFLKIMKHSEYDVVEQLAKTPARISIFSLIMSSEAHRKALQRVLDSAYVRPDITPEKVVHMVNAVKSATQITFYEDEIVPTIAGRPKALHITLKCHGYIVAKVLIDNGSALNVLPLSTLQELPVDMSSVKRSDLTARGFDGGRREVFGEIHLPLEIGPSIFTVEFHIMNFDAAYTMLLGRPWIHDAGAIPSTLHQRIKYIKDSQLITIKGEEELMISKPSAVPYIENVEQTSENLFRNFEIVETSKRNKDVHQVVTKIMKNSGFEEGKGLGVKSQGVKEPITLPENPGRQGLGYNPPLENLIAEKMKLDKGKMQGKMKIPHIRETFQQASEIINLSNSIATTEEEGRRYEKGRWIQSDTSKKALANWESEIIPDVMSLE